MNEYRQDFDAYLGEPPRTSIDVDRLVVAGRRSVRVRRLAAASGAFACCAAVVAAVTVFGRPVAAPVPPAAPSASATVSPSLSPVAVEPGERVFAVLLAAVEREAPQVTGFASLQRRMYECELVMSKLTGRLMPQNIREVPYDAARAAQACPPPHGNGPDRLMWQGTLRKGGKAYHVKVEVYRTEHFDPGAPPVNETDANERRIAAENGEAPRRGPDGESVLVMDYLVNATKPDGTGVFITCRDLDETGAFMVRSPFTADQLAAITLDPALHL
ncbi:hypothetical protein [Catellatospora sp. NPDC049609]|uniref:hypothetical protein n=1 Tax=Catellatospora sp. NPDC049609 TaxID=3155505 RepID=UPI0034339D07